MTREEIDKVIERAETFNSEDRSNRGSEYVTEHGLIGAIEAAQLYINRLLAAVKQLRDELSRARRDESEALAAIDLFKERAEDEIAILEDKLRLQRMLNTREWQPIETAPKDGMYFIALTSKGVCRCQWGLVDWGEHPLDPCYWGWNNPDDAFWFETEHDFPTHWMPWMPLPDAPQDFINDRIEKGRR